MGLLKRSREKLRCNQDPESGAISCELNRKVEGGGEENLAGVSFQMDANCKPVVTSLEGDPDAIERLRKGSLPFLKQKCDGVLPKDY